MERFDVLVVGAGPAGSVAALTLARNGCRVALVDRADFPRDKACGDVVGPRGTQLLGDLDVPVSDALTLRGMDVIGPGVVARTCRGSPAIRSLIMRSPFPVSSSTRACAPPRSRPARSRGGSESPSQATPP